MHEVEVYDVFAAKLPEGMDPEEPNLPVALMPLVIARIWAAYDEQPAGIKLHPPVFLVTNDPDEADSFQPAHECPACRAGADQMRAFMVEYPDRYVVLANLHYVEVWD